ncbi:hypothetical protein TVAG_337270 [Trichomonas vaginalis G3]|uniref:Uncharacterized protein n=1 Tax=Trichomonas vaginalis (strain ATCC PRA-98 / G3) TaxID=412133 RepID=A2FS15_TRIV3|nr:armadillo (ARM) repeat-containing protein family [Trichomonas vaginalis G3]EAX92307.1 hypothetical protein TVAG_337270 [Trichomonas vaginalis G3]KAI5549759.1 armadillo (ARM) repeat-containing protein family [Trichomonas vaginalis G3]|eukprot:XP_001305237.1 hypothetical protein [Trichomonas vaginalis G3]
MTTHPLFLECKSIHDKEVSIKEYKAKNISRLFGSFSTFLHPFQKQVKKGIFKKDPVKTIRLVLDVVYEIVEETTPGDYTIEMIDDIKQVFITLLHPLNWNEYRYYGTRLLCLIVNILNSRANFFVDSVLQYVLDFTPFSDQISPDSNLVIQCNPELRIQINDSQPPEKKNLILQLQYIISNTIKCNDDLFLIWWKIIMKILLQPCFRNIAIANKMQGSEYGINGPVPEAIMNELRVLIKYLVDHPDLLLKVFEVQYCPEFIFEFFTQLVSKYSTVQENVEIVLRFIMLLTEQSTHMLKKILPQAHDLVIKQVDYILKILETNRQNQNPEFMNNIYEVLKTTIISFFTEFQNDDQIFLIKKLMTFDNTPSTMSNTFFILLTIMYNIDIIDPKCWGEIVQNLKSELLVNTMCIFTAYLALCNAPTLLQFSISDLSQACKTAMPYITWNRYKVMSIDVSQLNQEKKIDSFFKSYARDLLYKKYCDHFVNMNINVQVLKNSMPTEKILEFTHLIRDTFSFSPNIYISYINAIVNIAINLPYNLQFNKTFVFSEYLNFLRKMLIDKDPSAVVRSTTIIGDLLSSPVSNSILSNSVLAEIYEQLMINAKSDVDFIKSSAYFAMIKFLNSGLRYSSYLTSSILESFDASNTNEQYQHVCSFAGSAKTLLVHSSSELKPNIESSITLLTESLSNPSKVQVLLSILIEEAINNRKEIITSVVTQLLNSLQNRNVSDAIVFSQIIHILPNLIQDSPNVIPMIITASVSLLEHKTRDFPQFSFLMARIIIDILLNLAQFMDVRAFADKVRIIIEQWNTSEEKKLPVEYLERVNDQIFILEMLMRRIPLQSYENPPQIQGNLVAFYKDNEILKLNETEISSTTYAGRYNWKYEIIGHEIPPNITSNSDKLPPISSIDKKEFSNSIQSEISSLFNNDLPRLGITTPLSTPENVKIEKTQIDTSKLTDQTPENHYQVDPSNYIHHSAQFMTALGYYKVGQQEMISPSTQTSIPEVDDLQYLRVTTVSLVSFGDHPQFEELVSNLGLKSTDNSIIYANHRRKLIFVRENEAISNNVAVIWKEDAIESKIAETCKPEVNIRLVISPLENGLIRLEVGINKNIELKKPLLNSIIVSKQALPIHVISQIISTTEIIDADNGKDIDPILQARNSIKKTKESLTSPYSEVLYATKELLKNCK